MINKKRMGQIFITDTIALIKKIIIKKLFSKKIYLVSFSKKSTIV
jgi:hypothetical protein